MKVELYQLVSGTHSWWRLQVCGAERSVFLRLVREAAAETKLTTGIIGARTKLPEGELIRGCGYLNAPTEDAVLAHAEAVARLAGVPLELGDPEVVAA